MSKQRDYDLEMRDTAGHRYAYGFDFDVMHPYMIRSFEPFFRKGSLLELGSFKGDLTRRFLPHFDRKQLLEALPKAAERRIADPNVTERERAAVERLTARAGGEE